MLYYKNKNRVKLIRRSEEIPREATETGMFWSKAGSVNDK